MKSTQKKVSALALTIVRKSLRIKISSAVIFHCRELSLMSESREMNKLSCIKKKKKMGVSLEKTTTKRRYPSVLYPHTYIALYSRTPKLPVTHTHTHKNKKLLSIPLKLVPSLAKLPSLVTPFPLGGTPPTPITSHSIFCRHQSNSSVSPLLTFVCCR